MAELDLTQRIVYAVPGMDEARVRRDLVYRRADDAELLMDVYSPAADARTPLPAVFFVHGGPLPPGTRIRASGFFQSYGALAAASGCVGVCFQHRLYGPTDYPVAESDVLAAIDYVRAHAAELGVDDQRLALWVFSGGGPLISWALREPPAYLRCLVAFYSLLDLRHLVPPNSDPALVERVEQLSPAKQLAPGLRVPVFVARAGRDSAAIHHGIDTFVQAALNANIELDFMNHAEGAHTFELLNDDERSRRIIARAVEFVRTALDAGE